MSKRTTLGVSVCLVQLIAYSCGDPPRYEKTGEANVANPPLTAPTASIELVEEGFLGQYNIIRAGGRYYAMPQNGEAFDADKAEKGEYARIFIANDLTRVKEITREGVSTGFGPTATMLVEEGYKGTFNIIQHNGTFYALAQSEGAFDPKKSSRYRGASLEEVKQQIP
jgi:hypothetical protein